MPAKWACPKCYHLNNDHATYCLNCGYYREKKDESDYYWKCPICQEENSNNTIYCIKCGHHVDEDPSIFTKNSEGQEISKRKNWMENSRFILIIELIILGIALLLSIYNQDKIADVFLSLFIIHVFFGLYYILLAFIKNGFGEMMKSIFIQGGIFIGMFIVMGLMDDSPNQKELNDYSLNYLKNNAIEVDYDELYHIAFEGYGSQRKQLVKFTGKVFLLDGSDYMMIDMSTEPLKNKVVYVKRKEQDYQVSVNDQVEIYGKIIGTVSAGKHLDAELTVPVIESYSLYLR